MKTYFANKKHTVGGFSQYAVGDNNLVLENIKTGLGINAFNNYKNIISKSDSNSYMFARFDKYIAFVQYKTENGLFMSLSEFIDIETVIDLHYYFRESGWNEEQILQFTKVAEESLNSDYEDCEIKLV